MTNDDHVVSIFQGSNAELMAYVQPLWFRPGDVVLDPTYGRGNWWTVWRPQHLIRHDLALDGIDFRYPVEPAGTVDVIAFDPPYTSSGSDTSSKLIGMRAAYGVANNGWEDCFALVRAGIKALSPLLKPTGRLLVKAQDYTESGRKHDGLTNVAMAAQESGLEFLGRVFHHSGHRKQPARRRQLTVHEDGSFLMCYGRGKAWRHLERTAPSPGSH